ncbi:hypothetical protein IMSAGC002_02998 [Lachnospiraceae bacterium]|nr:hypothetical protein IMSAGC002_02998 [Lachnospiraceae bacterium]
MRHINENVNFFFKYHLGTSSMIKNHRRFIMAEYSGAAKPPVRCLLSQSTDGIDLLLFCLFKDGWMW